MLEKTKIIEKEAGDGQLKKELPDTIQNFQTVNILTNLVTLFRARVFKKTFYEISFKNEICLKQALRDNCQFLKSF